MMTYRELINSSLRLIGVIASGETPSADEFQDSLDSLNNLVDSWKNHKLLVISRIREEFDLISNKNEYLIGPTGDFVTSRPSEIFHVGIKDLNNNEIPLEFINYQEWARITSKESTASVPTRYYVDYTPENVTLKLFEIPIENRKIVIYSKKEAVNIADVDNEIELQPGFKKALKYNLALELGIEFSRPADPLILKIATDTLKGIKKNNVQPAKMISDAFGITSRSRINYNGRHSG